MGKNDPIDDFEHSHGRLSGLAIRVAEGLRALEKRATAAAWQETIDTLEGLRDELLRHFADEEEALFPFVRAQVPDKAPVVDRLQAAHDTICGCIVRMVHLAEGQRQVGPLLQLHGRFETAYALHSTEETDLLEGLGTALDSAQRKELAERLRGL